MRFLIQSLIALKFNCANNDDLLFNGLNSVCEFIYTEGELFSGENLVKQQQKRQNHFIDRIFIS